MAALKVKIYADFICPGCKKAMIETDIGDKEVITCYNQYCSNYGKYFEVPEIEVKEYENRDGKEPD